MRSGFKQSLAVMTSMAVASMMDWSKAYAAKAKELPPALESIRPHSFARKSRLCSYAGEGKQAGRNRSLASEYRQNPMNYLPGRDTARFMKIKDEGKMMKAAREALDAYRAQGQCLDKVQPRSATWNN